MVASWPFLGVRFCPSPRGDITRHFQTPLVNPRPRAPVMALLAGRITYPLLPVICPLSRPWARGPQWATISPQSAPRVPSYRSTFADVQLHRSLFALALCRLNVGLPGLLGLDGLNGL